MPTNISCVYEYMTDCQINNVSGIFNTLETLLSGNLSYTHINIYSKKFPGSMLPDFLMPWFKCCVLSPGVS